MTEAWFSPETARLFSYLSLLSLCSVFAVPAKRGQLRCLAMSVWNAVMGLEVAGLEMALLAAGAFAAADGQPGHVPARCCSRAV